jgi:hypothetical protein
MLICFMAIWNILQTFGIFYDHFLHFVFIWYIFRFGIMYQEKSDNPVHNSFRKRFGQIFTVKFRTIFHPQTTSFTYLSIMDNNLGILRQDKVILTNLNFTK